MRLGVALHALLRDTIKYWQLVFTNSPWGVTRFWSSVAFGHTFDEAELQCHTTDELQLLWRVVVALCVLICDTVRSNVIVETILRTDLFVVGQNETFARSYLRSLW